MPYKEKTDSDLKVRWTIRELSEELSIAVSMIYHWERERPELQPWEFKRGARYRNYDEPERREVWKIYYLVKILGLTTEKAQEHWDKFEQFLAVVPWDRWTTEIENNDNTTGAESTTYIL